MDSVKQSAALCLLRLYKASPDLVPMGEWTARVVHLLNDQHMGVVTAAVSLITCLCKKNPDDFKTCISLAVSRLSRDGSHGVAPAPGTRAGPAESSAQGVPSGFPEDAAVKGRLVECLETVLNKAQEPPKSKKVQHSNAKNAILFETISLIIHYDSEPNLLATVLEEMPPFPERESSILAKLKRKKGPGAGSALDDGRREPSSHDINGGVEPTPSTVSTPSPSADLLGLRAAPPPAAPPAPSGAGNLLVDVFSDGPAAQTSLGPTPEEAFLSPGPEDIGPPIPEADELLNKFVCRNNGVLFENQLLQIGVKSEFRQNLGRMYLFYGNKTSVQFQNFSPTVVHPGDLQTHILSAWLSPLAPALPLQLAVQTKRVASQVDGGAQVQQVLNIECLRDFLTPPLLSVRFR
ncbi:AP-2 complex subunit alpha-1, partial [Eschrichtius robustus]|nr:AP-2 complex subunit alpha-1 [Eschrichtius robustus]